LVNTTGSANAFGTNPVAAVADYFTFAGGTLVTGTYTLGSLRGITVNPGGGTIQVDTGLTTTYGGIIAGGSAGVLTKTGAGTLSLSGVQTHTGGLAINGGTVNFSNNNALQGFGGSLSFNGGTLDYSGAGNTALSVTRFSGGITSNGSGATISISGAGNLTVQQVVSGSGGLTRTGAGAGLLTLSANNTYSGNTTVSNGTLAITTSFLADASTVILGATGQLALNFIGTDAVAALTLNGTALGNGTYGATGSGATNINDVNFGGTGSLTVGAGGAPTPAPTLTVSGSVTADNVLNLAESAGNVTITGSAGGDAQVGDTVTLTINTVATTGTLDGGRNYSISVTGANLLADPDNVIDASVSTTISGNTGTGNATKSFTVDIVAPTITPAGGNTASVNWGSTYTDAGATSTEGTVITTGSVNTATPDAYTLFYNATDAAGNPAATVNRTVTVSIASPNTVGADGYSPLIKYALGATNPTATIQAPQLSSTATTLVLTATVRTNDAKLTVIGEAVDSLTGTWGTGGTVTVTDSANQASLPTGTVRKDFTVTTTGAPRKFLRLNATLINQ